MLKIFLILFFRSFVKMFGRLGPEALAVKSEARRSYDFISKAATKKWGSNYEMVNCEIDMQCKAIIGLSKEIQCSDYNKNTMKNARSKWKIGDGYDYEMVVRSYKDLRKASFRS